MNYCNLTAEGIDRPFGFWLCSNFQYVHGLLGLPVRDLMVGQLQKRVSRFSQSQRRKHFMWTGSPH